MNIIGKYMAFSTEHRVSSVARLFITVSVFMLGSVGVHASSVPMLFDFVEESLTGTFSYDNSKEPTTFDDFPGITAYDLDSLLVNHSKFGTQASWSLDEQVSASGLGVGETVSVFFDKFDGAAIGTRTGSSLFTVAIFKDTETPFNSAREIRFNFSLNETDYLGNPWQVVTGSTRVLIQKGITDSSDYSINAVPLPAAVWLFTSGLIGLIGFARRKV